MTQVNERGNEGNTEVFKAYLHGRKRGQRSSRGASADYHPLSTSSRVVILLTTMVYFEYYYPRTAVVRR